MDELEFAQQFAPTGPPTVNDVLARAMRADLAELDEARKAKDQAAEREAQRENLALANRQMGNPLGNATRAQMAVAEARDKVRDLEGQLEQARQVLHRAAGEYVDWQESAEQVTAAVARRSDDADLLRPAKEALAAARVEQMLAARSRAPQQAPRPFARGGAARRSERAECAGCRKVGFSAEESFLVHQDPDMPFEMEMTDLTDAADALMGAAPDWPVERQDGQVPMIYR